MHNKSCTIKKRQEFLLAQNNGAKLVTESFILFHLKNKNFNYEETQISFRYGITASKKIGNAVQRNKAKRRIRHLIAKVFKTYAPRKKDYIIIARKRILFSDYKKIEIDMINSLTHCA